MRQARWLALVASVVLIATALFHASGYPAVARAMEASNARPPIVSVAKALWLMFSSHLIVLGLIVLAATRSSNGRQIILLCALMPAVDTALTLRFAGVFIGTISLAVATLLLLLAGLFFPRQRSA